MREKGFEVVDFDGEIDEMVSGDHASTANVSEQKFPSTRRGRASLSDFAKEVKGGNRATRRAEAKRIRKAFK